MTPLGLYLYGILIGTLVVVIRLWGGMPEGVMYAILLANAASPLIAAATAARPSSCGVAVGLAGAASRKISAASAGAPSSWRGAAGGWLRREAG